MPFAGQLPTARALRRVPLRDHHAPIRNQVHHDDLEPPLEDWGKLLGDVPAATAILDRFLHHAEIITITGRSYRLKDKATKDADKPKEPTKDDPDKEAK